MRKLVVFYSYTAENTRHIAERVARETGADLAAIETAVPYMGSYQDVVDQGLKEVKSGYTPKLKELSENPADYDEVIVGTPTWWYDMAPAVLSFLRENDLSGKRVALFQTNAGWPGDCLDHMEREAKGANVIARGLFTFSADDNQRDLMTSPDSDVKDFIARL